MSSILTPTPRDPARVVVTGSPCTGKTTLARRLADRLATAWSCEYARIYQDEQGRLLTIEDVEPIARGQIRGEQEALRAATTAAIHDTDLLSTVTYSRHYYDACPEWIVHAMRERRADLYLLLFPDVPWIDDGLQRDRPHQRQELHALFARALADLGANVVDVHGPWAQRDATADEAVTALLTRRGRSTP